MTESKRIEDACANCDCEYEGNEPRNCEVYKKSGHCKFINKAKKNSDLFIDTMQKNSTLPNSDVRGMMTSTARLLVGEFIEYVEGELGPHERNEVYEDWDIVTNALKDVDEFMKSKSVWTCEQVKGKDNED